ncbi:tyrosine-type recombinase/integrase [Carnobacterium maltaromaticum]|uniref:tyrosine-type recombinase/integrase n=1 Tax=Carnobacterium maltaromaticum TaxID=2751 RepID=UPI002F425F50
MGTYSLHFQKNSVFFSISSSRLISTTMKICNRSDKPMDDTRLHDFRHSHVAYIIDKGEEPVLIKDRLGHASITTTIDTYGHLYPNKQQETSDKLDTPTS